MSNRSPDALIVGAGIVGAAIAWQLATEGLQVCVIDSGITGGGSSAAGMGHIVAMDGSDAEFALCRYSQKLWDQIVRELPLALEYERKGTIWIAEDEEKMQLVREKAVYYAEHGVESSVLDAHALKEAEPELCHGLAGGLLVPGDSIIYPPAAVAWFLDRATKSGATIMTDSPVRRLFGKKLELLDGTKMEAGLIVNAAGVDALDLLATPLPGLTIRAKKGHLVITERAPVFCHHQLVDVGYVKSAHTDASFSVAFNLQPRKTGQVLIGSSRQLDSHDKRHDKKSDKRVEALVVQRMLQEAARFTPRIGELTALRVWTGFRAASGDGLPMIGEHPACKGLFLATGHEGLGITTALGTARLIADLVFERGSEIATAAYALERAG